MNAFIFPGQGSQTIGMGKSLSENFAPARLVFEEVDAALGQKLSSLMWEGSQEDLTLTQNAQPALMAVSLAVIRTLEAEKGLNLAHAKFLAGHSLGEYSALCAGGVLSLSDTAKLLRIRGVAMQKATPVGIGAMAALIGLEFEAAAQIAAEAAQIVGDGQTCQAANDNGGGQVVLSGHKEAIDRACEIAKAKGAKRALLLPVSAPFHCDLMQPAAEAMAEALKTIAFNTPKAPIVVNVLAQAVSNPNELRSHLVTQVTGTVRWRESIAYMADQGVETFYECGAGKVLSGLIKRIAENAKGVNIGNSEDIVSFNVT
jgi:[acyl-carrier-protein] S-malonyltransferase